ncbi:hypothetical protein B0H94_10930 [Salsuginibacillus halophilus]|uniref:Type IV pilus assembly protein PilN n=1 Tax=Salsuginibacillus halophilus TaxID=517424 RepID=A0A2P8HCK9_9BACI|nr:hypothetical protein [Salsuginibacillus halophilus]PSL43975.1 hypothetical protein B0H94_10930 [Salsuginibacillus halophilus]
MFVDVNLLPEKVKRDYSLLAVAGIALAGLLLVFGGFTLWESGLEQDQAEVQEALEEEQVQAAALEEDIEEAEEDDTARYEEAVAGVEGRTLPVAEMLDELVSLLPESGYFLQFEFDYELEEVFLSVQFDDIEASASYQHELSEADFIEEAHLHSLDTVDPLQEAEATGGARLPRYHVFYRLDWNHDELQALGEEESE